MATFIYCFHKSVLLKLPHLITILSRLDQSNKVHFAASWWAFIIKDTHTEKAPSYETPALTKGTNMSIWIVGTSNQLFIRGS